jgi:hypothetical protein
MDEDAAIIDSRIERLGRRSSCAGHALASMVICFHRLSASAVIARRRPGSYAGRNHFGADQLDGRRWISMVQVDSASDLQVLAEKTARASVDSLRTATHRTTA